MTPGKPLLLYIEDEPDNFQVANLRLRKTYELIWAKNDREACDRLREHGGRLHAILMDLELKGSELDGRDLTRLVRGTLPEERTPPFARKIAKLDLPVVVMTAYGNRFPESELRSIGASHYIPKPVNFVALSLALAAVNLRGVDDALRKGSG